VREGEAWPVAAVGNVRCSALLEHAEPFRVQEASYPVHCSAIPSPNSASEGGCPQPAARPMHTPRRLHCVVVKRPARVLRRPVAHPPDVGVVARRQLASRRAGEHWRARERASRGSKRQRKAAGAHCWRASGRRWPPSAQATRHHCHRGCPSKCGLRVKSSAEARARQACMSRGKRARHRGLTVCVHVRVKRRGRHELNTWRGHGIVRVEENLRREAEHCEQIHAQNAPSAGSSRPRTAPSLARAAATRPASPRPRRPAARAPSSPAATSSTLRCLVSTGWRERAGGTPCSSACRRRAAMVESGLEADIAYCYVRRARPAVPQG